jgi:hypothetical protein
VIDKDSGSMINGGNGDMRHPTKETDSVGEDGVKRLGRTWRKLEGRWKMTGTSLFSCYKLEREKDEPMIALGVGRSDRGDDCAR